MSNEALRQQELKAERAAIVAKLGMEPEIGFRYSATTAEMLGWVQAMRQASLDIQTFWYGAALGDTRFDAGWYFYDHTNNHGEGPFADQLNAYKAAAAWVRK